MLVWWSVLDTFEPEPKLTLEDVRRLKVVLRKIVHSVDKGTVE